MIVSIVIFVFMVGIMGYFVIKSWIYESVVLIFIVFLLFCLDFFLDWI